MNSLGLNSDWRILTGTDEFFMITKSMHNALQGEPIEFTEQMFRLYLKINQENAERLSPLDADFIIIHDPQPAAFVKMRRGKDLGKWIWRCHIDLSTSREDVWGFLKPFIEQYDATIFHTARFCDPRLPVPQFLIPPSIDPLSPKNQDLSQETIERVLQQFDIPLEKPIITQVSRFDKWKDPRGVIQAYRRVKESIDCQLVLAGGFATDDPEGKPMFEELSKIAQTDKDIHLLNLPPFSDVEINAFQRASAVVVQKSLKEGFGLTVTEALWKKKPIIGGAVGGIPLQVRHGITGFLVHSIEGAAYHIKLLLRHPELAKQLGENGYHHVKQNFLLTRHLRNYLALMLVVRENSKTKSITLHNNY